MKTRRVILTLLAVTLFLFVTMTVLGATLHVGPGQTYSGTTQDAINRAIQAAKSGDTVYLHAATYNITGPIIVKSGITIRGDGNNTIIHGAGDNVCNNQNNEKGEAYYVCNDVSNYDLLFTLPVRQQVPLVADKVMVGNVSGSVRASNCTVHNVTFTRYIYCDGVPGKFIHGITVRDCEINAGMTEFCFYASSNCKAYNNLITVQSNNAIRIYSSSNVEIYKNNLPPMPWLVYFAILKKRQRTSMFTTMYSMILKGTLA